MFKTFTTLYLLFTISHSLSSQTITEKDSSSENLNKVIIKKDARIDKIIETHKNSYTESGFRIQIFSGNKRQPARDARAKYISLRHDIKAHEIYQQPYFKVRVGDFRTKLEALSFQKEIASHFPNCFIVKDEIEIEELLKQ